MLQRLTAHKQKKIFFSPKGYYTSLTALLNSYYEIKNSVWCIETTGEQTSIRGSGNVPYVNSSDLHLINETPFSQVLQTLLQRELFVKTSRP